MEEIWKPVVGYEYLYEVSSLGRVRSLNRITLTTNGQNRIYMGQFIKTPLNSGGYPHMFLYNNNLKKRGRVHRLVAEAFIPNPENKPFVNHIDGVKTNNHVSNLEWCTSLENIRHANSTGLNYPGRHRKGICGALNNRSKKIGQYNIETGELVKEYHGISEARRITGVLGIANFLTSKRKHAGGFIWKYH